VNLLDTAAMYGNGASERRVDELTEGKDVLVATKFPASYSAAQMRTAYEALRRRGIPLASNQVQYSLLHREPQTNGVLAACRELGVTLIAYMPLASGALTGKYSAAHRPAGWRRYAPMFRGRGLVRLEQVNQVLRDVAQRHNATPSQVALRWLVQQDNVVPIPGAKNGRQAAENAGALSFELSEPEMAALSGATAGARTR
jgi:aryl-alcohol dehydrogenase-like predicted oxidoreductase